MGALEPRTWHYGLVARWWAEFNLDGPRLRGGELVAKEEHMLEMTLYFTHELVLMLEQAGFSDVELRAGYRDAPPSEADDFVVFLARRPEAR